MRALTLTSSTAPVGWRCLILAVAIVTVPALNGVAGAWQQSGDGALTATGAPQTASVSATRDPSATPTPDTPAATNATGPETATQPAAAPQAAFSPPVRLPSLRNIDFRLRPNAGIRLPALGPRASGFEPSPSESAAAAIPWSIRASLVTLGADRARQSAKFQEYRDVRDASVGGIEAHFRNDTRLLNLVGRHLGLRDQDVAIDGGEPGKYLFAFGYGEIPHNFSYDSRSLFAGIGTGQLTVSDRIQADLQSSTTTQEAAARIAAFQGQSPQTVDLGLLRRKIGVDFALLAAYPFTFRAVANNESRSGMRPSAFSFGLGNFEEVPWPVSYDTQDVRLIVEYVRPESRLSATGTYRVSLFDNHVGSFRVDNPWRITDTSVGSVGANFAAGPSNGLLVLPPSNDYQEATVSSIVSRLPRQASISGLVSLGFLRQNDPLVPFSTNTVAVLANGLSATDPAALPRSTAEAAMNTALGQVRLSSQPARRVRLGAEYRFFNLDNNETPFTMSSFIREDADLRRPATTGGTYAPVLAAYNRHTASAEGNVNIVSGTDLSLVYTFERMNRDFREVAWMNDHRVKVSLDTRAGGRVDWKTSYERSSRDTAPYIINQYNVVQGNPLESPMMPFLRKFDEAARTRDEVQSIATLEITDALSLSGMALYGRDDFSKSPFGLVEDLHRVYSLDGSYVLTEALSLYASYSFERYASLQRARQWTGTSVSNPYNSETGFASNSNWEARPRDDVDTASLGVEVSLIPQRLRLNMAYTYSRTDGLMAYASPLGAAPADSNAFEPAPFNEVDDVEFHSVNPELEYRFGERLALSAGYHFEKFTIADFNYQGFTYTPRNLAGGVNAGLLMGSLLFPRYDVNAFYVRVRVGL